MGLNSIGTIPFTVGTPPTVSRTSPQYGPPGTVVTITGTGFGASQGSSTVSVYSTVTYTWTTWTPTSWSDTQIVVPVPSGMPSGLVYVYVTVNGLNSIGTIPFTVAGIPPSITASVSPAANAAGWYNSTVVITFDCTAGTASLASCSPPQTVSTEGTGQIVTGTATDAAGLSASTSVTLNVEKTPPIIAIGSPAEQSVLTSSSATVTGTVTNSLTSASGVTCNGVAASLSGGAFSCNISLVPGVNLVMVNATDVAGNMAGARLHLVYSAALPPANALQVTPAQVTMLVGETQQFTAVDEQGRPRPDATWTVSDTNIAAITTDSAPTLTGLAAGQVTLTAAVGSASADAQVTIVAGTSLPVGTVRWSAPPISGFTTQQIVEGVPSGSNTPDLYSIDQDANGNTLVRAFTGDGQQLWSSSPPMSQYGYLGPFMGDASGGLLIGATANGGSVIDLDGQTGAMAFSTANPSALGAFVVSAVGPEGNAYVVGEDQNYNQVLYKIDGTSGQASILFVPPFGVSETTASNFPGPCQVGPNRSVAAPGGLTASPIVGADGIVRVGYTVNSGSTDFTYCLNEPTNRTDTNSSETGVAEIAPSGDVSLHVIASTSQTCVSDNYPTSSYSCSGTPPGPQVTSVLPDGHGGILAVSTDPVGSGTPQTTDTTSGSTYAAPLGGSPLIVLGENGNAFVTDGTSVAAFDPLSGAVNWSQQLPSGVGSIYATRDGGLSVIDGASNLIALDSRGSANTIASSLGSLVQPSWKGYWFADVRSVSAPPFILATTDWPMLLGDFSLSNFPSRPWYFILNWQNAFDFVPIRPTTRLDLKADISYEATIIKKAALDALAKAYRKWPVVVVEGTPNTGDHEALVLQNPPSGADPSDCGDTDPTVVPPKSSTVSYECVMGEAQVALQTSINNVDDETNALARKDLIQAIGRGIGNTAAHEIAHQFLSRCCSMDALISQDPEAAGTYNNGNADADPNPLVIDSDPSPYTGYWKDGKTRIRWENSTERALDKCLSPGYKNFGLATCAANMNLSRNSFATTQRRAMWTKTVVFGTSGKPTLPNIRILRPLPDLIFLGR